MEISKALRIIEKSLKKSIVETQHFVDQCLDRNLDLNVIREKIKNSNILGILEQNEGLYKIWFEYEKHKDLNIILKIQSNESLRLITIFPCYAERRKRK